jgi:hypothetical protein
MTNRSICHEDFGKPNALLKRLEAIQPLKRPRGALRRAIVAGIISTDEAHKQGYMGKDELLRLRQR